MLANKVVGLATQVYEQLEATGWTLASVDNICHVRGENEGSAVPGGKERRRLVYEGGERVCGSVCSGFNQRGKSGS